MFYIGTQGEYTGALKITQSFICLSPINLNRGDPLILPRDSTPLVRKKIDTNYVACFHELLFLKWLWKGN